MMEREMITMIVDTLPVFYYEKMMGYMPFSFVDLVFAGERIGVGLRRGKFDYAAPASTSNRRFGASRAKKKEGDTHAVTSAPTWPKPHQPIFPTPTKLLGQQWKPSQSDARPTKVAHSATKASPTKLISRTILSHRQLQS